HLAGDHRLALRAHRRAGAGAQLRRAVAPVQARGLLLHHPHLFHGLLRDVALQPVGRETTGRQQGTLRKPMTEPIIRFDKVNKWHRNDIHVLRDIDLSVAKGERIVICGPSGSDKSTLIRCINRLEEHQQGTLEVDGVELTDNIKAIDEVRKKVGMVFQQFNLFPHLTVLENLTLSPMWVGKLPKKEAEERAMQQLSRVRIAEQ